MTTIKNVPDTISEWFFFSGGPGAPRYGDDPTKHAVDHDTESFVREVIQNANDQRLDNDDPVEICFRFHTLVGEERDEFLEAIGWEAGLRDRLQAVSAKDTGRGYDRFLERLAESDSELRLLVIEDKNTTGLTGRWDEDSNFAALVRDELYSSKQEDTAGGSYGLGKSVLWTFSGASTVLFNSSPVTTPDREVTPRFVGRTKLPTHELGDVTYQGAGWFCNPQKTEDGIKPSSIWGHDASGLANQLYLERPDGTGTRIMVIGFWDPTRDTRPELEELADEFVEAAVKYFWPAMQRGDLRVTIETPEEEFEANVENVPAIQPFVDCFEQRSEDHGTLEQPGDVAGVDIPMNLPARADKTETPNGDVRLAARLASPTDDDTYLNKVALFRGAGMVVKYLDQSRVAFGDRNFHAVLACGEARHDGLATEADLEIDRFLRYSEPPEHDDWMSTENLREQYSQGFRTALDEMFGTVRDGLRHLVARSDGKGESLSRRVRKRFPIHDDKTRRRSVTEPTTIFDIESTSSFEHDRWTFEGRIEVTKDEFEGWSVDISMEGVGEDGGTFGDVPIESVWTSNDAVTKECENGAAKLVTDSEIAEIEFGGQSYPIGDADAPTVTVGETRLDIRAELRTQGGE